MENERTFILGMSNIFAQLYVYRTPGDAETEFEFQTRIADESFDCMCAVVQNSLQYRNKYNANKNRS